MKGTLNILPNLFIVGAPKSGTSTLHIWLGQHPEALGSKPKETYYFVDPGTHMFDACSHVINGLDGYQRYFEHISLRDAEAVKVIFESTPSYMYQDTALRYLPGLASAPKFLFLLRQQGNQIYSLYNYFRENWSWVPRTMGFGDFIQAVESQDQDFGGNELASNALGNADYLKHLEKWRSKVGFERMKVLLFEDMLHSPQQFYSDILEWLRLSPSVEVGERPHINQTYFVRSPFLQKVNIRVRDKLPKGRGYRLLRNLYHTFNAQSKIAINEEDARLIDGLNERYKQRNVQLAQRFDIDLKRWSGF